MTETEKNQIHEMHSSDPYGSIAKSPPLNDNLFARELDYQASMSIAERLLRQGLLIKGEAHETKTLLLAKYRPLIGELLAEVG